MTAIVYPPAPDIATLGLLLVASSVAHVVEAWRHRASRRRLEREARRTLDEVNADLDRLRNEVKP